MTPDTPVWHAVIRTADGTLRCMDPGCGFNDRRPGANSRHLKYHRATDLEPAPGQPIRTDGPDRRVKSAPDSG